MSFFFLLFRFFTTEQQHPSAGALDRSWIEKAESNTSCRMDFDEDGGSSSFERLEWQDAALSRVICLVFVPFNLRRIKHSFELGDTRQECFFTQSDRATPVIDFAESSYVNVLMHFFDFNVNSGSIEPRSIGIDYPLPTRVTPFFTTKKKHVLMQHRIFSSILTWSMLTLAAYLKVVVNCCSMKFSRIDVIFNTS